MTRTLMMMCCGLATLTAAAGAQRRVPPGAAAPDKPMGQVTIALKTGNSPYQGTGPGTCTHAPVASVYGVLSEQWSVDYSGGQRSMHLTVWKPKSGSGEMFSLSLSNGTTSQTVNTVRAPGASPTEGSGSVTLAATGTGGTFTVEAKDARGSAIAGTIKCDAFSAATAEGGD